jgi:antitoxin CptB
VSDTKTADTLKRLYWHSRRGMLELDLLLVPFARDALPSLAEAERVIYGELLQAEDQDLFLWLTQRAPGPERLRGIIARILAHASAS